MSATHHPSRRSLVGLSAVNFLIADMLTGFGPFVTIYLVANHWQLGAIENVLSVGTFAAVIGQLPAGALVDAVHHRLLLASVAILGIVAAAVMLALFPQHWTVLAAEALQGVAAALLGPAIAAITLALSDQERLGELLGSNVRFKALGSMITAVAMGAIGTRGASGAVFYVSAALGVGALGALWLIRPLDLDEADVRTAHPAVLPPRRRPPPHHPKRQIWRNRDLMIFAACAFAFQLCNAALFPFAMAALAQQGVANTSLVVAAGLVVSQTLAALISPLTGRLAQRRGRRMVLLAGFVMLPLRAVLYAVHVGPAWIVAYQVLDGVSAAVFGVMVPLVIADITFRSGRFNLAMGVVGFIMTIGAALSTLLAGFVAQRLGIPSTFLALAVAGAGGCLLILFALPETSHIARRTSNDASDNIKDAASHAA